MNEEKLSGALQENILTLLVFSDSFCKVIRHSINPNLFESSVFREIANHAIDFIDQFNEAIKDHLPDSMEAVLKGEDDRKAKSYTRVLDNLFLAKDSVNGEYVISKLHEFIRQQNLKSSVIKVVEALEDGRIADAEVEMQKGLSSQVNIFDSGTTFANPEQSLKFFDLLEEGIPTGIEELDKRDICPRAKEMFLIIAPPKKGKSWTLIHFAKHAILARNKVLHITLEMSEERVCQRYVQSFFSISKRQSEIKVSTFEKDKLGRLINIDHEMLKRPSLMDDGIKTSLGKQIKKEFIKRPKLIIKNFPTGSLTVSMLKAYLDGLERFEKFTPDVLLIDYPDLMFMSSDNVRQDTGKIFKDLRGLAGERNLALVTVTQGNREASKAKLVTDSMVGEDYSKIATADNVLTYSQTEAEKAMGLARLYVSNGRNDEDKFTILISQSYAMGQFCLDSTLMLNDYWKHIDKKEEEDDD